jgi:hypothetical protein
MIRRLWRRYMADIDEYEQAARASGDKLMLAMVQTFKTSRISALCMAAVMLLFSCVVAWKHL